VDFFLITYLDWTELKCICGGLLERSMSTFNKVIKKKN